MNYDMNKMNGNYKFALAVAVALTVFVGGTFTLAQAQKRAPKAATNFAQQPNNNKASTAFTGARDLIDDAQWAKAAETFAQYISAFPQEKNLDAAMYWMAYAQYKLNKFDQSKETIDRLLKAYDKSAWKEDAELLMAQLPGAVKVRIDPIEVNVDPVVAPQVNVKVDPVEVNVPVEEIQERVAEAQARAQERAQEAQERAQERVAEAQARVKERLDKIKVGKGYGMGMGGDAFADDDPCEFKIVVLQALFESDPQRGIAVANDWLKPNSGQTPTCKRAALRLLARHGGKTVTPTILSVAQNESDLRLRTTAISLLGATNDESVIDPLRDFALNSPQTEIFEAALYALGQNNSTRALNAVADVALSNKPVALRRVAIASIANRSGEPAVDALFKIYDSSQDLEIRTAVIRGLGGRRSERAGARLLEIAERADNVALRKAALSNIGRRGGEQSIANLIRLYDVEKNEELKEQIMNAMAYSNDQRVTHKLISIARDPQTPIERRRRAIMLLSNRSKDPEVIAFLEALLKQ